jgi:hypothetical protein
LKSAVSAYNYTRWPLASYFHLIHNEPYYRCILNPIDNKIWAGIEQKAFLSQIILSPFQKESHLTKMIGEIQIKVKIREEQEQIEPSLVIMRRIFIDYNEASFVRFFCIQFTKYFDVNSKIPVDRIVHLK